MFLNNFFKRYEQSSNFLEEDIITLREKQNRALEEDVKSVMYYRTWIQTQTNHTFENTRILGIVAATKGAENYLPHTIPKIIQQISEIGMMADIVIGLNNGFECPTVIHHLSLLSNIQIIHLYTKEKVANNIAAPVFDNLNYKGKPYCLTNIDPQQCRHRIFVLHQKQGQHSAGKIRVLGDIYGSLLLNSIQNGWIPPAILVTFDAESQFLETLNSSIIDIESNGLKIIVNYLQKHHKIDILGTRNKFAVYQKAILNGIEVLLPNFSEQVPPIQWFIDIVHGRFSGFQCKWGGGTFGRTDVIFSLLVVISRNYPGIRVEDTQLTILAKYAGFIGDIFLDVISTNRTPSMTDMTMENPPKKAWIGQIYRWLVCTYPLKLLYGKHNIGMLVNDGFPWFTFTNPIAFLKLVMGNEKINIFTVIKKIKLLMIACLTFQKLQKDSRKNPDILQGSEAKAFW
ncbi:hypothetical protein [Nostoc sp. TCL240-02]|uniref:hypothetical protein n=1 Tax=Nostoc sp. TCL240-02 TaxID=2572090 RepID=UPI00157F9DD8|nr:hypothetical protein [Nostoc sp. TCL240-02]QKQ74156.1 hypothetical protein FBB35_13230 [Nostoc sp. TCL240-02]